MPSKSEKQEIKEILLISGALGICCPRLKVFEDLDILTALAVFDVCRYTTPRIPVPKSVDWLKTVLSSEDYDEKRFRGQLRMSKSAFCDVVDNLKGFFKESQESVEFQVAIGLYHIGHFGNSASFAEIATKFGISEGTVENYTERTIAALVSVGTRWIRWPDKDERRRIGSKMAHVFLPKLLGFVDGSEADFYQAPTDDKQAYWSRKKKYCMQFQIVCDPDRLIRSLYTGYPGSVHDAKVFTSSPPYTQASRHFSAGEFIIGGSAYPKSDTVVVPYKKYKGDLNTRQATFNTHISGQRIAVEHTIGLLKGRFQSLRGLRINVDQSGGHEKVCRWIHASAILHNMLMMKDPWNQDDDYMFLEEECEEDETHTEFAEQNAGDTRVADLRRLALTEIVNTMYV